VAFVVDALDAFKDITDQVIDSVTGTAQYLNNGASTPTGWTDDDTLIVASSEPFNGIKFTLGHNASTQAVENNQVAAAMTVKYWDGESLVEVSNLNDGTAVSGKTFAADGRVGWSTPTDWKQSNPLGGAYPAAYVVEISVDATLTATLSLAEVGVISVPENLIHYGHCATKLSRLLIGERSDNLGQVDVSRAIEEYGIQSGTDSYSYSPGTQDNVIAIVPLYNEAVIVTSRHMYILSGNDPSDFTVERQDVAEQVPVNSRCIIPAPKGGESGDLQTALYYLNYSGMYVISGFQTRVFTGISRESLGDITDWWNEEQRPYLDKSNLQVSHGVYWPDKDLVVFGVPMIVDIPLDSGSAVADKGGGKIGLPATAHGLSTGESITVAGMVNVSGTYSVDATSSTNEIVVTETYAAETVTDAGVVYKNAQTSCNMLICYDLKNKIWHPPRDVAVDSLCVAVDYNSAAPGHFGKRMLLGGTSAGKVLRLFDDTMEDDAGSDISWSAETGWTDLEMPGRKRVSKITAWGLTAGESVTVKIYRDGSLTLPATKWEMTFTAMSSLPVTKEFMYDPRDPFFVAWLYKFKISGDSRADFFLEIEVEPYSGVR